MIFHCVGALVIQTECAMKIIIERKIYYTTCLQISAGKMAAMIQYHINSQPRDDLGRDIEMPG